MPCLNPIGTAISSFALALLFFTIGCNSVNGGSRANISHSDDLAWVAHQFTGGRQCQLDGPYTAPDTEILLANAGIEVYETRIETLAVCEACTCPAYSAWHYALIPKARQAAAQMAGFKPRDPPPAP